MLARMQARIFRKCCLPALATTTPFIADVWPYTTTRSVLDAGVKPEGVMPATSAAAEIIGMIVLETMMNLLNYQLRKEWCQPVDKGNYNCK